MTIVSTILGVESGGKNVTQGNIGDINNRQGTLAQGYFQITDPTWAQFGGLSTGYSSAIQAPYATQLQVAQNIPIGRWGPNTQTALQAAGYSYSPNQTLGQVMAANGETGATASTGVADNASGSTPASGSTDPLGTSVTQNPTGTATATPSTSTSAAQGAPIQTALQPEEVSQIGTWITGIESAFGGGVKGVVTAAETAIGTYFGSVQNWFTRAFLIILGIVVIGVALVALMWDHGGKSAANQAMRVAAA